jgi:hypothetical protein
MGNAVKRLKKANTILKNKLRHVGMFEGLSDISEGTFSSFSQE